MKRPKDTSSQITREHIKTIQEDGVQKDGEKKTAQPARPRVVVLGVGFSGLFAVESLGNTGMDVTVIDRHNYHTFFPLVYQVAAAELEPEDIAYPVRHIFRKWRNVRFILGSVDQVDFDYRLVKTGTHTIPYDYLIIGLGSQPFFFGVQGADDYAYPLKSLEQAIALRNQILYCFERASCEANAQERQRWLTFAIVGGGPTGVELAGTMAELIHETLERDYPNLKVNQTRVVLIEAGEHLLTGFSTHLGDYARARLEKMGVEVMVKAQVVEIGPHSLRLKDSMELLSRTVTWTAGVQAFRGASQWGLPTARNGQIEILPTLQAPGHPEVYVTGDLAHFLVDGRPLPMVAQVAIQEGQAAARNILRQAQGKEPQPFHYHDRGMLAVIGRNSAVAEIWGREWTGFIAWVIWLSVHILYLIGFRNRLLVLMNWAWDYFASERNVNLMIPTKLDEEPEEKGIHAKDRVQADTAGPAERTPTGR
jgi:NADH:ubiquinone reductase (H+-translocating)